MERGIGVLRAGQGICVTNDRKKISRQIIQ
jgi:hypothetical protein